VDPPRYRGEPGHQQPKGNSKGGSQSRSEVTEQLMASMATTLVEEMIGFIQKQLWEDMAQAGPR